jgi:WD40 repeat protein
VEILDLIELSSLLFISGFTNFVRVCFSGDGSHVICNETGLGITVVYSAVNAKKVSSFGAAFVVRDFVCSLNGVYCGAHSYDGISVWDIQTGELKLCIEHKAGCFCFGKDDEYLVAVQCYSHRITTWDLAAGDMLFDGFVSSVLYVTPLMHFSVSASAVVLRGHGDGIHYTLEIDPLTGNEIGRGDAIRDESLPLKMYVRGALSILL